MPISPSNRTPAEVQLVVDDQEPSGEQAAPPAGLTEAECYRLIAENSSDLICLVDQEARFVYASPSYQRVLGCDPTKLIGRSIFEFLHPDELESCRQGWRQLWDEGNAVITFRCHHVSKSWLWVEARGTVTARQGTPYVVGVARDVTKRKEAEEERDRLIRQEAARKEAEQLSQRAAFLAEASAILSSSLDYHITLASVANLLVPMCADTCIVDVIEADGQIARVAVAHADPEKAELARLLKELYAPAPLSNHPALQVLRSGQADLLPHVLDDFLASLARDAEHLAILRELGFKSLICMPLLARGRVLGALSLVSGTAGRYSSDDLPLAEELARRIALAIDNARLYTEAQEAIRTRDQFLSIASHELKTPISSVLGFANLLRKRAAREGSLPERDQRALGIIAEQAERLNKLVGALLDLSRISIGQFHIKRAPVDLCALAQRVVADAQPALERHTVELRCMDSPLVVEGDDMRLEQVLENLIQNAIKYSPAGGPVVVVLRRRDDHACVAVIDQGIGIPEMAQARLFQRFYRAPNVNADHITGMGVGLYVVKEIMLLHGGVVEVESQEGLGSTFTIWLPLLDEQGGVNCHQAVGE